jgi:hypothetical protein
VLNCVLNDPPGGIAPEFHPPLFEVDVCVVLSVFRQVTVPPTATVIGFGLNAVDVSRLAFTTIDAEIFAGGVGAGVGEGVGAGAGAGAGVGVDGGAGAGAGAGAGGGADGGAATGRVDGVSGVDEPQAANVAASSANATDRRTDIKPPLSRVISNGGTTWHTRCRVNLHDRSSFFSVSPAGTTTSRDGVTVVVTRRSANVRPGRMLRKVPANSFTPGEDLRPPKSQTIVHVRALDAIPRAGSPHAHALADLQLARSRRYE